MYFLSKRKTKSNSKAFSELYYSLQRRTKNPASLLHSTISADILHRYLIGSITDIWHLHSWLDWFQSYFLDIVRKWKESKQRDYLFSRNTDMWSIPSYSLVCNHGAQTQPGPSVSPPKKHERWRALQQHLTAKSRKFCCKALHPRYISGAPGYASTMSLILSLNIGAWIKIR